MSAEDFRKQVAGAIVEELKRQAQETAGYYRFYGIGMYYRGDINTDDLTRAVLSAIREPTEEMVMAGIEAGRGWKRPQLEGNPGHLAYGVGEGYQETVFRAMIDAALGEKDFLK
jgi:hypothetical protein